jgi:hypothetical protein
MDEQRALLDQLMGKTRDLTEDSRKRYRGLSYLDKDVCKYHLEGLCPYTLFTGTKWNLGRCPFRVCVDHPEMAAVKAEYSKVSREEHEDLGYDEDLEEILSDLVGKCNALIAKNERTVGFTERQEYHDLCKQLLVVEARLEDKNRECTELARNMHFSRAAVAAEESEKISRHRDRLESEVENKATMVFVCDKSGNFVDLRDSDERLMSHFKGKQYLGWNTIRKKLAELREQLGSTGRGGTQRRYRERDGRGGRDVRDKRRRDLY